MKDAFILDLYTDYLMASFNLATATGMSATLDGAISHDQISRFLGQGLLDQKQYWQCIKRIIRKIETDVGIIKIDDTILDKPHSKENDIICWHWDHSKKGRDKNVKGVNIVNFLYENELNSTTISVPLAFEIIKKTEQYFDKTAKKVKRRSPVSKHQLVQQRLRILQNLNRVKFKYLSWDTWFSSADNFKFVHKKLKKYFVAALKSNRKVALSWEQKLEGKFTKVSELDLQPEQAIRVWLKGLDFPVQLVKQVFLNKDGSRGELFVVTNDLKLSTEAILAIYQSRWSVEVLHKSLKQNVGLEKSPTKNEVTQSNHIFAAMIAWTKLEMLSKLKQTNHFALKAQLYVKAVSAAFDQIQQVKQHQLQLAPAKANDYPLLG